MYDYITLLHTYFSNVSCGRNIAVLEKYFPTLFYWYLEIYNAIKMDFISRINFENQCSRKSVEMVSGLLKQSNIFLKDERNLSQNENENA